MTRLRTGHFLWCYNRITAERLRRLTYDVVREARRSSHPEIASAATFRNICRDVGGFLVVI